MLAAARQILVTRPGLWLAAGLCSLLAALPGGIAVTYGAAGGVAFLLTGDPRLALDIWEQTPGVSTSVLVLAATALVLGFVLWVRIYTIAVGLSRPEGTSGWREAHAATRRTWRTVLLMHLQAYAVLTAAAVGLSVIVALAGPAAFGTVILLGALGFAVFRTIFRIVLSIAQRAVVFDGLPAGLAWRSAIRYVRARRHDVAVTWVGLIAIGVSLWIAGRLVTPVLQETAFDYPSTSGYEIARQLVQLLVALPIESALLGLGIAAWSALYDGAADEEPRVARAARRERTAPEPWVLKALGAALAIALVGNGGPTLIADARDRAIAAEEAAVTERDVKPEDALADEPSGDAARTSYTVDAALEGEQMSWTTAIDYLNTTGETLDDIGVNVYAAAYARPLEDVPFARDLITSDFNGEFQALARAGEITEFEVSVAGRDTAAELDGTSVVVDLPRALEPRERAEIRVDVTMRLPRFPERFGRWHDLTLLGNWIPTVAVRDDGGWRLERFGSIGDPFVSEVADYDVAVTVDENEGVVGTGALVGVEDAGEGSRRWSFAAPGVRDAAYVAGPFVRGLEGRAGDTVVRSWYSAGRGLDGEANLATAVSTVSHYQETYGELSWPEVEVVATEGRLGGMEYPGVVFVSSASESFSGLPVLPDLVSYSGFEEARARYVVAHEIAHQWWYASVGNDQIDEPWLDEAFAEAATRIWLENAEDGERTRLLTNLSGDPEPSRAAVRAGIGDFDSNEVYADVVYLDGSEVLMELRRAVGQDTYDDILRTWHDEHSLEIATVDDFASTVVDVGGEKGRAFVEEWL